MFAENQYFNRNYLKTQWITLLLLILISSGLISCKTDTAPTKSVKPQSSTQTAAIPPSSPPLDPSQDSKDKINPKHLKAVSWSTLPDWQQDNPQLAWKAFLQSCQSLAQRSLWRTVCAQASAIKTTDEYAIRLFLEKHFTPYQVMNGDGTTTGLITGYYEPLLKGSRQYSPRFRYPLYSAPDDLLTVELAEMLPDTDQKSLRGRLEGKKILPYYTRAEIENNRDLLKGKELIWVEDEVELFFLQIQGSGRIILENGETVKIGYADNNGHPYRSIGKILIEQGELPAWRVSMQAIKQWGQQNPDKLKALLHQNARYIFFRELPANLAGPIGALGVPLTAGRSLAVDPKNIPLGAPIYLATTWPNTAKPLNRLMIAQDTGNAIKGNIRADFFWGHSPEAKTQAGKMKQKARMWVLLPKQSQK